jgi:hypothetical protein
MAEHEAREKTQQEREEARVTAEAEAEAEKERQQGELMTQLMDGEVDEETFQRHLEALDGKEDEKDDVETLEGEPEVTVVDGDEDDRLTIVGEVRVAKRKRTETMGRLREVNGKVCLSLSDTFVRTNMFSLLV